MDLKIKDVAELLSVSETTIRRWLVNGKIPAYRINGQYRFSRIEIEDWVMSQRLGQETPQSTPERLVTTEETEPSKGSHHFSLFRAIHKGGVYQDIVGNNKAEVIHASMNLIASHLDLDADVLTDLLMDREKLMPTALNNGVAVPHTRDFLLNAPYDVITVVFLKEPIEYGALDHRPVHTLFFLLANEDKRHLHLLAKIAHFCSDQQNLNILQMRPNQKELLDHVRRWESAPQKATLATV